MRHRVLAGALATLLALSGCGDDDDGDQAANSTTTAEATTTSTGDALCAAIDDAEQDTGAPGDIDVLAEGTDAVEARLTTIRDDLAEIRERAPDTTPEESEAFDSALASLGDAITAVADGSLTAESAQDVVAAGASTVEAGQAHLGASTTRAHDPTTTRDTGGSWRGGRDISAVRAQEISWGGLVSAWRRCAPADAYAGVLGPHTPGPTSPSAPSERFDHRHPCGMDRLSYAMAALVVECVGAGRPCPRHRGLPRWRLRP